MKVVVATNNPHKLRELSAMLPTSVTLLTLRDAGLEPPEETGATFVENALVKARAAAASGMAAIADDSGLKVEALDGAPGVYSARYSGPDATDLANNRLLLSKLSGLPRPSRRATFESAVAYVTPDGREVTASGEVRGVIVDAPRGTNGFGYDPLFEVSDPDAGDCNGMTFAELPDEHKNKISHRARAYAALAQLVDEFARDCEPRDREA